MPPPFVLYQSYQYHPIAELASAAVATTSADAVIHTQENRLASNAAVIVAPMIFFMIASSIEFNENFPTPSILLRTTVIVNKFSHVAQINKFSHVAQIHLTGEQTAVFDMHSLKSNYGIALLCNIELLE